MPKATGSVAISRAAEALDQAGTVVEEAQAALERGDRRSPLDPIAGRFDQAKEGLDRAVGSADTSANWDMQQLAMLLSGLPLKWALGSDEGIRTELLQAARLVYAATRQLVEMQERYPG